MFLCSLYNLKEVRAHYLKKKKSENIYQFNLKLCGSKPKMFRLKKDKLRIPN